MVGFRRHCGFSLTEVLLAVGTLAVGMLLVAGVFPMGIHLTTVATERSIAAVVADEAFAKIRIYGVDPTAVSTKWLVPLETASAIPQDELFYPSSDELVRVQKQYCWLALCKRISVSGRDLQVTVFVCRTPTPGTLPELVQIGIQLVGGAGNENKISVVNPDHKKFISDGSTIVDRTTGGIYRVVERQRDDDKIVILDRPWEGSPTIVGVAAPLGGRNPDIAVYQKVISF